MTAKKRTRKTPSAVGGAARLKDRGESGVVVAFTPDEKNLVRGAAGLTGRSLTGFLRAEGIEAAKRILAARPAI